MRGETDSTGGVNSANEAADRSVTLDRRTLLRATAAGGATVAGVGMPVAAGDGNASDARGFPPGGITEYGQAVTLGNGTVRTFTSETPSGAPRYHGVEFDRAALAGLPTADDLAAADNRADADKYTASGQAGLVHFKQSLQFFVPFPDAAATPFTFLGLNWNPGGHFGGKGAWLRPHFDVHFHMLDPATVDAIEGPRLPPYDTGNGEYTGGSPAPDPDGEVIATNFDVDQLPAGYARPPDPVADQRYISDMGEHAAPVDAPELPDGPDDTGDPDAFSNTLIQGFVGNSEGSRLAFVEPMLTREYLLGVEGRNTYAVPQPRAEYPHDEQHPHEYSVRRVPSRDSVVVVLQDFRPAD